MVPEISEVVAATRLLVLCWRRTEDLAAMADFKVPHAPLVARVAGCLQADSLFLPAQQLLFLRGLAVRNRFQAQLMRLGLVVDRAVFLRVRARLLMPGPPIKAEPVGALALLGMASILPVLPVEQKPIAEVVVVLRGHRAMLLMVLPDQQVRRLVLAVAVAVAATESEVQVGLGVLAVLPEVGVAVVMAELILALAATAATVFAVSTLGKETT
jgi:hypothetical protein